MSLARRTAPPCARRSSRAALLPRRLHTVLAGALLLAIVVWVPTAVRAAVGDMVLRAGPAARRVTLSGGYGSFLSDRYGVDTVDLHGTSLALFYQSDATTLLGVERSVLDGDFRYRTLNGVEQTAELSVTELMLKAQYLPPGSAWELGVGAGNSTLTRRLYGYHSANITAGNLGSNSGRADATTNALAAHGEALYHFGGSFSLDVGLRYTYSRHQIPISDERPAYDAKGRPTSSTFDVGGGGYQITLSLRF